MTSKRLWMTIAIILALFMFDPHSSGVWAQLKPAVCAAGWEWSENSLGQDPCLTASLLDAACSGTATYAAPALNSTQNYSPPQKDSAWRAKCHCNSVMYSLYMGCTVCQGARIYLWPRWIYTCDQVYLTEYPIEIAQGTAIPRWAFYDVSTLPDQTFNYTVAMSIGRDPEATHNPAGTSTGSGTPGPTNKNGGGGGGGSGKSKIGPIAGGAAGGVLAIIMVTLGVVWYVRRREQGRGNEEVLEYDKEQPVSSGPNHARATFPYYNPDDPSTYPPPMVGGRSSPAFVGPFSPLRRSESVL